MQKIANEQLIKCITWAAAVTTLTAQQAQVVELLQGGHVLILAVIRGKEISAHVCSEKNKGGDRINLRVAKCLIKKGVVTTESSGKLIERVYRLTEKYRLHN